MEMNFEDVTFVVVAEFARDERRNRNSMETKLLPE